MVVSPAGQQFGGDPLLRRCRTSVRDGRSPAEIAHMRPAAGHGIRARWCRSWVSAWPT